MPRRRKGDDEEEFDEKEESDGGAGVEIDEAYYDMANEFLIYDNRQKETLKELKEIKLEAKALKDKLTKYMEGQSIDKISTDKGTIILDSKQVKPNSVNKKVLKEQYQAALNAGIDPRSADKVTDSIFESLPNKKMVDVKQLKERRQRKKKQRQEDE